MTSNDYKEETKYNPTPDEPKTSTRQQTTPDEPKTSNRQQRRRILPSRPQDCILGNNNDPSNEEIINFVLFANCESFTFEEASSDENLRKVMDEERNAIEKNKTWELT